MKHFLLILSLAAFASLSFAQNWQVVQEGNMEYSPNDGFFMTADTGLYVGNNGVAVLTTDGGQSGITVREPDGSGRNWRDVEFANTLVGYACSDKGFIYKTTDGGLTWANVGDTVNYTDDLLHISVINANVVYVAGKNSTLLKTTDGGKTWAKSSETFEGQDLSGGIDFCSETVGVVAVDYSKHAYTWYTHDGGATWTENEIFFPTGATSSRIYDIAAGGDSTIVAVGYNFCIFVSQDGGKTFTQSGSFTSLYVQYRSVDVVDKDVFVAGGSNGHVVITTDGGANWTDIDIPTGQTVKFVDFLNARTGYVFGDYGQWFRTDDGGATWKPLLQWPNITFKGLAVSPDSKILVTGWAGEMSMSSDGGNTWSYPDNHLTGSIKKLYCAAFADADNGLIGGYHGELYRTTNGGITWTALNDTLNPMYNAGKSIYAIHYLDENTVLAGGSSGHIMKSTDRGQTWTELVNNAGNTIYDIWPVSGKQVLLGCSSGKIAVSNATVDTFNLAFDYGSMSMRGIAFHGDNGVVVASKGYIFHTTVANWDTLSQVFVDPDGDDLRSVAFVNDSLVYAVGGISAHGVDKIYYSKDGGLTWQADVSPTTEQLERIAFADNKLWIAGYNGTILMKEVSEQKPITGLYINEFMASNDSAFADENGEFDDWIEIYNANNHAVDVGGLYITDDLADPTNWQIPDTAPDSTTIPAGGFLILWADKQPEQGVLHVGIKLGSKGEQIGLTQVLGTDTTFIDSLSFGSQTADKSMGRLPDGGNKWVFFDPSSPGETNANGTSIHYHNNGSVSEYRLAQNYPNPFNPVTTIEFSLKKAGRATVIVYSVTGQKVATLLDKDMKAGANRISWNAGKFSSGVYFYELKSGRFRTVKKMLLMK